MNLLHGRGDVLALHSYDALGFLVKVVDAVGNATHLVYDSNYNLTQVIDAGRAGDSLQLRPEWEPDPDDGPGRRDGRFSYSGPFNRMTSYTDPNGNTTNYGHDSQGNCSAITYANGSQEQFSYDPLGNLTESINRRGQAIQDTYNSMGQVTRQDFADGTYQAMPTMPTAT